MKSGVVVSFHEIIGIPYQEEISFPKKLSLLSHWDIYMNFFYMSKLDIGKMVMMKMVGERGPLIF